MGNAFAALLRHPFWELLPALSLLTDWLSPTGCFPLRGSLRLVRTTGGLQLRLLLKAGLATRSNLGAQGFVQPCAENILWKWASAPQINGFILEVNVTNTSTHFSSFTLAMKWNLPCFWLQSVPQTSTFPISIPVQKGSKINAVKINF